MLTKYTILPCSSWCRFLFSHRRSADEAQYLQSSIKKIHDAIPPELFIRDTKRGLFHLTKDLIMAALLCYGASYIDTLLYRSQLYWLLGTGGVEVMRWGAWAA
jgi:omega-6 fatty acid desaturase (delta-12 desaturase)